MVSLTVEYALRALVALTAHDGHGLMQGRGLAKDCDIPANYMSKILWHLGKSGIIDAVRGVGGGYRLARSARDIHLKDVFNALEKGDCRPHCLVNRQAACRDDTPCVAHHAWRKVHRAYLEFLDTMTLADIANHPSRSLYERQKSRPRSARRLRPLATAIMLLLILFTPDASAGDAGEPLFQQTCAACHSIGQGRRLGPDLRGVEERRQRDWLIRFIVDPKRVLDSGDADAQALLKEYGNLPMPATGMDDAKAAAILDHIRQSSAGAPAPVLTQTPGDVGRGLALFLGSADVPRHGVSCASCHAVSGMPMPGGGGALGPDLTTAAARLGGEAGLSAWLAAPPTPVMRNLFAERPLQGNEAHDIAAWLATSDSTGEHPFKQFIRRMSRSGMLFVMSCFIAMSLMAVINLLWHRRVGSVRATLSPVHPGDASDSNRSRNR